MNPLQNKKWIAALVVIFIITVGAFFIRSRTSSQNQWIEIRKGPIIQAIYGLGTLTPERQLELKPGMAGTLDQIFVVEGQQVKKGDALVQLNGSPAFKAPFDGEITSLPFQLGENVFPQIPILTLMDLKNLYIQLTVEQSSAIWIRPGQETTLSFESLPNQSFHGQVRSITPKSGQFSVRVDVKNLPEGVLPGMTADCAITVGKKTDVLLIPLKSIRKGKALIQTDDGKKAEVSVETGIIDGEWAEWKNPVTGAKVVLTRGASE